MKNAGKECFWAVAFVLIAAVAICLTARALRPVREGYGTDWPSYLDEPRDSLDYLCLGSSYAYCDVDPLVVYEETGLTGYVVSGPVQTLDQSYWCLKEALRTQTPGLVVLEITGLEFQEISSYTQINVGYMPAGANKLGAIFRAADPALRTGLLCDLYFYHSRWCEVRPGEVVRALLGSGRDLRKGFTPMEGTCPDLAEGAIERVPVDEEDYRRNLEALCRIARLCQAENIPLALTIHPTYDRLPEAAYDRIRDDLAQRLPDTVLWDWSTEAEALGLSATEHYYDPGHLNREGARIFSARLGAELAAFPGLTPRTQTAENAAAWASLCSDAGM